MGPFLKIEEGFAVGQNVVDVTHHVVVALPKVIRHGAAGGQDAALAVEDGVGCRFPTLRASPESVGGLGGGMVAAGLGRVCRRL